MLRLDLHVHTEHSRDCFSPVEDVLKVAKRRGLDGIAITDHDEVEGIFRASDLTSKLMIIPGIEVNTKEGHIIALGVSEKIPCGLSASETVSKIRELGGLVVAPHPYKLFSHNLRPSALKGLKVDAVETLNATDVPSWLTRRLAERLAERLKAAKVAGSDSHLPATVGRAYTLIESSSTEVGTVLKAIAAGRTRISGSAISLSDRLTRLFYRG